MPTATQSNTTPTRRSALGFSAAALFAGFTVPAIAGAPPIRGTRQTPIAALQKQLIGLATMRNAMDEALLEKPRRADYDALHKRFDRTLYDCLAVQGEIAALPAETLEDAAVQATVAYYRLEGLSMYDEEDASDIRDSRALLASIILVLAKSCALDIDQLGMGEMRHLCARFAPNRSAAA